MVTKVQIILEVDTQDTHKKINGSNIKLNKYQKKSDEKLLKYLGNNIFKPTPSSLTFLKFISIICKKNINFCYPKLKLIGLFNFCFCGYLLKPPNSIIETSRASLIRKYQHWFL